MSFLKPTVAPAPEAPAKKSKLIDNRIKVEGLAELAALMQLRSAIEGLISTRESEVRRQVSDMMITKGMARKAKPESFYASGVTPSYEATANCGLRRRASNRPFSDDEIGVLQTNKISMERTVTAPATLAVNAKYLLDQEMLGKVDKAVAKIGLPDDFIVATEEQAGQYASDISIDDVLKLADKELVEQLLPVVTTLAIGRYSVTNSGAALQSVKDLITTEIFHEAKAEEKPKKKLAA